MSMSAVTGAVTGAGMVRLRVRLRVRIWCGQRAVSVRLARGGIFQAPDRKAPKYVNRNDVIPPWHPPSLPRSANQSLRIGTRFGTPFLGLFLGSQGAPLTPPSLSLTWSIYIHTLITREACRPVAIEAWRATVSLF